MFFQILRICFRILKRSSFFQAAGLFHDVSLGVHMQLTIVRIIRLEVEENEVKHEIKMSKIKLCYFIEDTR